MVGEGEDNVGQSLYDVFDLMCVLLNTTTMTVPTKLWTICMLTSNKPFTDWIFNSFVKNMFKWKKKMLPSKLVWLTFAQRGVTNVE